MDSEEVKHTLREIAFHWHLVAYTDRSGVLRPKSAFVHQSEGSVISIGRNDRGCRRLSSTPTVNNIVAYLNEASLFWSSWSTGWRAALQSLADGFDSHLGLFSLSSSLFSYLFSYLFFGIFRKFILFCSNTQLLKHRPIVAKK